MVGRGDTSSRARVNVTLLGKVLGEKFASRLPEDVRRHYQDHPEHLGPDLKLVALYCVLIVELGVAIALLAAWAVN